MDIRSIAQERLGFIRGVEERDKVFVEAFATKSFLTSDLKSIILKAECVIKRDYSRLDNIRREASDHMSLLHQAYNKAMVTYRTTIELAEFLDEVFVFRRYLAFPNLIHCVKSLENIRSTRNFSLEISLAAANLIRSLNSLIDYWSNHHIYDNWWADTELVTRHYDVVRDVDALRSASYSPYWDCAAQVHDWGNRCKEELWYTVSDGEDALGCDFDSFLGTFSKSFDVLNQPVLDEVNLFQMEDGEDSGSPRGESIWDSHISESSGVFSQPFGSGFDWDDDEQESYPGEPFRGSCNQPFDVFKVDDNGCGDDIYGWDEESQETGELKAVPLMKRMLEDKFVWRYESDCREEGDESEVGASKKPYTKEQFEDEWDDFDSPSETQWV